MSVASLRYRIEHCTEYRYSEPVAICQNQLRMQPQTRSGITCHESTISITPVPETVTEHVDYFGNRVYSFAIETLHKELTAVANSDVTVEPPKYRSLDDLAATAIPWTQVRNEARDIARLPDRLAYEFLFDSPRVMTDKIFSDYAIESFQGDRAILEAALDLTKRIHKDFRYDTTATDVHTPTINAFRLRAGVCQDFAHVQIACLRSIGLPARYVSGYLRTIPPEGKPRMVGADESHAWLSVYGGPLLGWIDCDPTNACLCGTDHIPICVGRDYGDVSPMRGVILGGGQTSLKVRVDVEPLLPATTTSNLS
ncbi:transglutaminase family protein [Novipirellula artificiosorum]|uniref:Protein-glutamine gamma-glutamyltransferase n=1 Tax=Novipirellula artificiosorum TaxID=2528016 RepID=A0A5C6DH76_9BACT|nr:transglutaminase family protein [Novipirellula artificiosorum]TWU35942.1 Protein-glutamine gamma-glutamyltransferase [Novipirellula artificiosorum]